MLDQKWINTNSFKNFKTRDLQDGRFRVKINKGDFEGSLYKRAGSKNLFVVLSGGWDPEKHKWPYFQHMKWQKHLDGNVLYVADPTLLYGKELRVGWYVGTKRFNWMDDLGNLVKHIAESLEVTSDHIYPIGDVAGGFAALMLATKLGDSTAIAINPQTDVLRYHKRFVNDLLETCFDGIIASRVPVETKARFSAGIAYQKNVFSKAVILQNKEPTHQYMKHYLTFCEMMNIPSEGGIDPTGRIQTILYDEKKGKLDVSTILPILQQKVGVSRLSRLS